MLKLLFISAVFFGVTNGQRLQQNPILKALISEFSDGDFSDISNRTNTDVLLGERVYAKSRSQEQCFKDFRILVQDLIGLKFWAIQGMLRKDNLRSFVIMY